MDKLAQINQETLPTIFPPARFANISSFVNLIIPIMLTFSGIVLLGMLFWGAFKIMTAGGNPENIQSAKKLFQFAVLGFIIIITSFVVVKVLGFVFNIEVFI